MPNPNLHHYVLIWNTLIDHPGSKRADLARLTGIPYDTIQSALHNMERHGFLLSEDAKQKLYPFARRPPGRKDYRKAPSQ